MVKKEKGRGREEIKNEGGGILKKGQERKKSKIEKRRGRQCRVW
jgi:hypothetical protein